MDYKKLCIFTVIVMIFSVIAITANAAIFDDQIPPKKAYTMIADRTAMYSDLVTVPAGGTVEVDLSSYFDTKIISFQGTNTVSAHAFFIAETATAGKFLITGTASDIISFTVWGKLD